MPTMRTTTPSGAGPDLSVILLCYKAKERAPALVEALKRSLAECNIAYEIILVANYDAGDTGDTTPAIVRALSARDPYLIAIAKEKKGMYGWDVRSGFEHARGKVIAYVDGDGQDPVEDVARLYQELVAKKADMGIGYRVKRYDGLHRVVISRIYQTVLRLLFPKVRLIDPNSKPKMLTREALASFVLKADDWFIDAEIVIQSAYAGLRIVQVPTVMLKHEYRSTFVNTQAVWKFAVDLIRYRFDRNAPWRSYRRATNASFSSSTAMRRCIAHAPAVLAALAAALVVSAPLIAFPFSAGSAYRGINITAFGTDEHYYISRMKEALDGHTLGQPFLHDGKAGQDTTFGYTERALAAPALALGLGQAVDAVLYVHIVNTAGVFLLVLLLYALTLRFTENRAVSIGAALFVVLGYSIIQTKSLLFSEPNIYGRSFFPFASSVPFFLFLIALFDATVRGRKYAYIAAGICAGALFYIYFFAWTFAFAVLLSLGCIYLLRREWRLLGGVATAGLIALALGSYNLYNMFRFLGSAAGAQVSYYQGHVLSHVPVMSKLGLVTIVLASISRFLRGSDERSYFAWALIGAGWIAVNQQVISGRLVQYGHYYWYFIVPISVILGAYFLVRILPSRYHAYLGGALIALALINGVGQQYRSFNIQFPEKIAEQRYAPALAVLRAAPRGVVLAGAGTGTDLFLPTMYTSHDLYWIPAARLYGFPMERLKEALEVHLFLNRDARHDPTGYLRRTLEESVSPENEYVYLYIEIEGFYSGYEFYAYRRALDAGETSFGGLRERLMRELADDYRKRFSDPRKVRALLLERGVKYLLWDKTRYPEWDISFFGTMEEMASSEGLMLYRLAPVR